HKPDTNVSCTTACSVMPRCFSDRTCSRPPGRSSRRSRMCGARSNPASFPTTQPARGALTLPRNCSRGTVATGTTARRLRHRRERRPGPEPVAGTGPVKAVPPLREAEAVDAVKRRGLVTLGERRVVEDGLDKVVDGSTKGEHRLADVNQLRRFGADDVHAEHP